ncbi:hypothetical protein [Neobacillus drentensis]|jgi:glycerophosphoryl diester phosphodiesterase|uniref:hypothetical protein n=1 Tax=Neobacillus drentensis TaxID=220684 RepID=UPI003B586204
MKITHILLPKVPIGILTSNRADTTEQALKEFAVYADYFNPSYGIVTEELVNLVHANGFHWNLRIVMQKDGQKVETF